MGRKVFEGVGFTTDKTGITRTGVDVVAALSDAFLTPAEAGAIEGDETDYVLSQGDDREWGIAVLGVDAETMTLIPKRSKINGTVTAYPDAVSTISLDGAGIINFTANGSILSQHRTHMVVPCSDESSVITAGVSKMTFRSPVALKNLSVKASLRTQQTSGTKFTVDINKNGVSIFDTKLTIDNNEKTSVSAGVPAVITDGTEIAEDDEITIDFDAVGQGGPVGAKVTISGDEILTDEA